MAHHDIPEEYLCPITHDIMTDPVVAQDGITYERTAILTALSTSPFSPMTRQPMSADTLVTNYAIRNAIERFKNDGKLPVAVKPEPPTTLAEPEVPIAVSATLVQGLQHAPDKEFVHITVMPPEQGKRRGAVLIAMLDVSGSMGEEASLAQNNTNETVGFSRLDLVKHSMHTIIKVMQPDDTLCIISFSGNANIAMDFRRMDKAGQSAAESCVAALKPDGQTNIWDALRVGIDQALKPECHNKNVVLMLLTDGEPNVNPPKGIAQTLRDRVAGLGHGHLPFTIHSFGYGFKLDSILLDDISSIGTGFYGYIPDCTMVGTIFVNFLSNVFSTAVPQVMLKLEGQTPNDVVRAHTQDPNGTYNIGAVRFGQPRNVVIERPVGSPPLRVAVCCLGPDYKLQTLHTVDTSACPRGDPAALMDAILTASLVETLRDVARSEKHKKENKDVVLALSKFVKTNKLRSAMAAAVIKDIDSKDENEGQLFKAVSSKDFFDKWGRYFLLSFVKAHRYELCSNFKDSSVQLYSGKMFQAMQDEINNVFCSLPPPKQSCRRASSTAPAPTNMQAFYNVHGGCFDGDGQVTMATGETKAVRDLVKGDRVESIGGVAEIVTVVETVTPVGQTVTVVDVDGVLLTPWHPVQRRNKSAPTEWVFPAYLGPTKKVALSSVFDVVLDPGFYSIRINGVDVVSLGHLKTEGVLYHPYFGTEQVIEDLKKRPGWNAGHVVVRDVAPVFGADGRVAKLF